MRACPQCGAPDHSGEAGAQCPHCGALAAEQPLEVDLDALRRPAAAGVERPDAAQIGGSGGGDVLDLGGPAPTPGIELSRPPAPRRDSRSFEERERPLRTRLWRLTRIPVLAILGWFTFSHVVLDAEWVFVDHVNLALHEGGHMLFRWGGTTLHVLGGTIGQLLLPALFAGYFSWKRQRFASAACIWWFGQNFLGIARYMRDAPAESLPLVGGEIHDWAYLFGKWDVMAKAAQISDTTRWFGIIIMLATLALLLWSTIRPNQRELAD